MNTLKQIVETVQKQFKKKDKVKIIGKNKMGLTYGQVTGMMDPKGIVVGKNKDEYIVKFKDGSIEYFKSERLEKK